MPKKRKRPPSWWSPRQWINKLLPSGHWSSRRQFLMQFLGGAIIAWFFSPSLRPQPLLQSKNEIPPVQGYSEGWPSHRRLRIVATATATNTNSPSFITPPFGPLKARDPLP